MASRYLVSRIDRYAGLSDRNVPTNLTRIESPELQDIDFSDRTLTRRNGYQRLTTACMKDASLAFNGYDDYVRIPYQSSYVPTRFGVSFHLRLSRFPGAETTVISRGFGTSTDRFFQISYDPTINSNLGGWRCRVYDDGVGLQNVTINDGDASLTQIGAVRYVSFTYSGSSDTYDFEVKEEDGTSVGSTTATVAGFVTNSQDWIVGVDTTDGTTIPSAGDTSYTAMDFGELRMEYTSGTSDALDVVGRDLRNNDSENEITASPALDGYWKFNEGGGIEITDHTATANNAVVGTAGPKWNTDTSKVLGTSGLEFNGTTGHIQVDMSNAAGDTFTTSGGTYRNWLLSFIFVPKLAAGETTVRDQTLIWSGASGAGNPEPVGVRVVSNQLQAQVDDGSGLNTLTIATDLDTYDGQPLRVVLENTHTASAEGLNFWATSGNSSADVIGSDNTATSGNPGTVSGNWSIGRMLSSFNFPQTYSTDSAYGTIDDVSLWRNKANSNVNWIRSVSQFLPGANTLDTDELATAEVGRTVGGFLHRQMGLALNEGFGNELTDTGAVSTPASIFPVQKSAFLWSAGLVCPTDPPEITLLRDYRRIRPDGTFKRSMLAISGTSLYDIDPSDGSMTLVTGGLPKGGKWSSTQYADQVYLACENGQRPRVYNGTSLYQVGIDAPTIAPVPVSANTGGSLTSSATYGVYITYRNSNTGAESNPSPVGSVTLGGSDNGITSVQVPVSADPQVNQRRIYLTTANGNETTATLSATIDDNVTTNYTTDINSVGGVVTLELVVNAPAPVGSLVLSWKDRLWVAGSPEFPTRVYYSKVGTLTSFEPNTDFLDADQDAGDPVVGLKNLRDELIAYLRDGRVAFTATGDTTVPFLLSHINNDVGAVSHHSILIYENRHIFLGERDVWLWAGEDAQNVSSPADNDRPSIKNYIRDTMADAYKTNAHIALLRNRDQVWMACTTGSNTRNDQVLVLDITQGVWSRYLMDMDVLAEIEDTNDEPTLYGGSRGYIVKLDTGNWDGLTSGNNYSVFSGTTTSITMAAATLDTDLTGLYCYLKDATDDSVHRVRISHEDDASNTIYFEEALPFTPANGDMATVGGIQGYADFLIDAGNPMSLKRMRWIKLAGFAQDGTAGRRITVNVEADKVRQTWNFTAPQSVTDTWGADDVFKDFRFGGLGRSFRVMVSFGAGDERPYPDTAGKIHISEFQVELEEVVAR